MSYCAALRDRRELSRVSGGYGEGETPLPFPNRAVKPLSADGTWLARAWESRTPPVLTSERAALGRLVVVSAWCAECPAPAGGCAGRGRGTAGGARARCPAAPVA